MILKLAFRNVFRQKRRSGLTIMTMSGGLILAALSIGLTDGTVHEVIDLFTTNLIGHIQVHKEGYLDKPSLYATVDSVEAVGAKLQGTKGVLHWAPRVYSAGLASVGERSTAVRLIGIDPAREDAAQNFRRRIVQGRPLDEASCKQAVAGRELAKLLKAGIDSQIVVVTQGADGSQANDAYRIVGLVSLGDPTAERTALYLHIRDAQDLLVLEGRAHELVVVVSGLNQVAPVTRALRQELSGTKLDVQPWQVVAKSFYNSMKVDERGHYVSYLVIMLIVAVGVLNTVLMSVMERTREYGVLRALGTRPSYIFKMVIAEVAMLALISIVIGVALGSAANFLLSIRGIRTSPMDLGGVSFSFLKAEVNLESILIPSLLVFLSALVVSLLPARRAATIEPAQAMRTQ